MRHTIVLNLLHYLNFNSTVYRAIDHIKPNLRKIVDEERLLLSDELKKFRVEGILKLISNCTFLAEITYPVKTDCGGYDHITAYKVHHCMHKTPMFGGRKF